ncbi:hypothetical protein CH375_18935 [Leptospira ellisii]|nr:hypothetical protein CH375_18935 [Leptospira ellisii]
MPPILCGIVPALDLVDLHIYEFFKFAFAEVQFLYKIQNHASKNLPAKFTDFANTIIGLITRIHLCRIVKIRLALLISNRIHVPNRISTIHIQNLSALFSKKESVRVPQRNSSFYL